MKLLSERLVQDLQRMPGASHSYLKQLCADDAAGVRDGLDAMLQSLQEPLRARARECLGSLDNRRFFQGFAEVAALKAIEPAGWELTSIDGPGPRLEIARPGAPSCTLAVLAFLHQSRPGADSGARVALARALRRVPSRHRFLALVRRWLPHDFDPEPVRRAVELWLGNVAENTWTGRYATYEDDHVSIEFALTGERARSRQGALAGVLGPFYAHRALEVIEPRTVAEMDRHVQGPARDQPLVLACVADQPWSINPGYLRDFLYGRPESIRTGDGAARYQFGDSATVCAFRDPLYACVSAMILMDRDPAAPLEMRAMAWLNPWARHPMTATDLGVPAFSPTESRPVVMRWSGPPVAQVRLG
jgi:hypothetical protein